MNKDDDYLDEDFTDYRFSELVAELERNGKILEQWENGAPVVDNRETAPKTKTETKKNE